MAAKKDNQPISTKNPYIFAEDLDEEDMETVKGILADIFESPPASGHLYGDMARRIRNELDKRLQTRGWSCVVGRSYGAYVTQKIKCYAYMSVYPGVAVLMWKA